MVKASTRIVYNRFPEIASRLAGAGGAASRAAADRVADDIRSKVRVDTGELRQSITVSEQPDGFTVSSAADQALSEEFGTRRQAPHATFAPAAENERPRFVAAVADEIARAVR